MSENIPALPALDDIRSLLRFESEEGRIWLAEERMVLQGSSEMKALRRELVDSLGIDRAKGLLIRIGYLTGQKDARTARALRPDASLFDIFLVGPQSHMVTGQVKVTPVTLQIDEAGKKFHGEFLWENSIEAEIFLKEYGVSVEPVCWTQIGYASGYTSQFTGRQIIFKEVSCVGCGESVCRIDGKPAEEWPDSEELLRYYRPDKIVDQLFELQSQVTELRKTLEDDQSFGGSIGHSEKFMQAKHLVTKAAESKVTVLLLGETGVGKDLFARALHESSLRKDKAFVAINCAAIPKDLIEAELFGVEKGAYTGAEQSRPGRFERAHGGTLFLDEVGELSWQAQAALLRVLQEGELERVGDTRLRKVDVRLVAATNEDLNEAVKEGRFRADLLYRLNVYCVVVPPLRDRIDDIPELVQHFIEKYTALYAKPISGITDKAMTMLRAYEWPGNIRELGNMIERGIILAEAGQAIKAVSLFPDVSEIKVGAEVSHEGELVLKGTKLATALVDKLLDDGCDIVELERELLIRAVERAGGNVTQAASKLGLSRATLDYRLKKHQIPGV